MDNSALYTDCYNSAYSMSAPTAIDGMTQLLFSRECP